MKAAVFYERRTSGSRTSRSPRPGPTRCSSRSRLRLLRLGPRVLLRPEPARDARRQGPARARARVLRPGRAGRRAREQYGLAEGDRVAVNPVQSCNACNICRAGNPHFAEPLRARRDDERRLRGVREDEDRARLQAPRLDDRRAGRVRRDARPPLNAVEKARDPARELRRGLRPGPGRALDGAAPQERGRAGRASSARATTGSSSQGRSAPTTSATTTDESSPYYVADLAKAIHEVNNGRARRPGDRRDGIRPGEPAGARGHRQRLDRRPHGPRRSRTTSSRCRCSRASRWTRRSASRGSTRTSGRRRSGCSRASSRHRKIITHSAPLDGIDAGDPAGPRPRRRRHQDRRQAD